MKSQKRNFGRGAIATVVALGALVWQAALGPNVARAHSDDIFDQGSLGENGDSGYGIDASDQVTEATFRNDATAHVIAAFAPGRGIRGSEVLWGETTLIDGAIVGTWSIVSRKDGQTLAAGATIPLSLAENQPQERGPGPAGAIASLKFPQVVQETTFFNHFELHTQPNGHPVSPLAVNPNRYRPPHFDFHFYAIPEEQVRTIPFAPPVALVPADRLPAGYAQPGPSEPEMGRHAGPLSELSQQGPFSAVMIAGFTPDAAQMHFVEPMVTRAKLLERQDFTLPMPMPEAFDRDTLYPTRFEAVFHGGAHYFIFSDFIDTNPATTAGASGLALAIPEPSGLVLLGLALPVLLRRRAASHV